MYPGWSTAQRKGGCQACGASPNSGCKQTRPGWWTPSGELRRAVGWQRRAGEQSESRCRCRTHGDEKCMSIHHNRLAVHGGRKASVRNCFQSVDKITCPMGSAVKLLAHMLITISDSLCTSVARGTRHPRYPLGSANVPPDVRQSAHDLFSCFVSISLRIAWCAASSAEFFSREAMAPAAREDEQRGGDGPTRQGGAARCPPPDPADPRCPDTPPWFDDIT